jgi:hypothetical protein
VEALPAAAPLFDKRHNPLWIRVSGDGAILLIEFWQRIDRHWRTSARLRRCGPNTRFLGDLYQTCSAAGRTTRLQTPEFVEEFILDRTLTPAIAELAARVAHRPGLRVGIFSARAFHRFRNGRSTSRRERA